VGYYSY